jgi:preprotein translocase subunit SecE
MAGPLSYLKETRDELQKVTWPTQQEVVRLTGVVIFVSILVGVIVGGLDLIFTKIMTIIIK